MAWTTGNCTGSYNLLTKLKEFVTANGWTCLADRDESAAYGSGRCVYFKGTGLAGQDEIYVGICNIQWTSSDTYTWALQGYNGFASTATFWTQAGAMPLVTSDSYRNVGLSLHGTDLKYWFVVNGRRIIVVVRVGAVYVVAYLGLYLPFALPPQMPYPIFIGGNLGSLNVRYSNTDPEYNAAFWQANNYYGTDSYLYRSHARCKIGEWYMVQNYGIPYRTDNKFIVGFGHNLHASVLAPYGHDVNGNEMLGRMTLLCKAGTLGELDGIVKADGTGASSENLIRDPSGFDWLLVQDTFNETASRYAAVALQ